MDLVRRLAIGGAAALALASVNLDTPSRAQTPAMAQAPGGARAVPPVLNDEQRELYAKAFEAADAGKWDEVRRLIARGREPLANKVLRWLEFQQPDSEASFEDVASFIDANPDWPMRDALMRRAEEALVEQTDDSVVLAWFATRDPLTADGAMRFADALFRAGDRAKAISVIRKAWHGAGFGATQERDFLHRFRKHLRAADHVQRLDAMIWAARYDEARRAMKLVDADTRALADARIRLATLSRGVDAAIRRVPERLQNDPGLLFERLRWRRRKGHIEDAMELLRDPPKDLGRPEIWWPEREYLARKAVSQGKFSQAYRFVRDHQLTDGVAFVEAEFLAGWIALRFTKDARAALAHFSTIDEVGRYPLTRSRGAYWAGRAAEAAGDSSAARRWYEKAAQIPATFYGQLAAAKLDVPLRWPDTPEPTRAQRRAFEESELIRVARMLSELGVHDKVKPFVQRQLAMAQTPGDYALAAEFGRSIDRLDLSVLAAKRSAQLAGVLMIEYGWPTLPDANGDSPERALIHATIRQESAFEDQAVSRVGARGMMQLMPATAKSVARSLGLAHSARRLLTDAEYNIRIGGAYLGRLIEDFGGSYVLALAAYNAGPNRVRQWIRENGDPRDPDVDVIDWIELMSFGETRNYVQRVLENLQVYRQIFGGAAASNGIEEDLRRGAN